MEKLAHRAFAATLLMICVLAPGGVLGTAAYTFGRDWVIFWPALLMGLIMVPCCAMLASLAPDIWKFSGRP